MTDANSRSREPLLEEGTLAVSTAGGSTDPGNLLRMIDEAMTSATESGRAIALVIVNAPHGDDEVDLVGSIKPLIRETDLIWSTGPKSVAAILVDADGTAAAAAARRIHETMDEDVHVTAGVSEAGDAASALTIAIANLRGFES